MNIHSKWLALISSYLAFLGSALLLFQVPPLLPFIRAELLLTDVHVGWLQGMFALPAIILAIIGGGLLDRLNSRLTGIIAVILMTLGGFLLDFTSIFPIWLLSRLLVGIGAIIINLTVARSLTLWFPVNQRGLAMSILHTAWPIAVAISMSSFAILAEQIGWHGVVLAVNLFMLSASLIFICLSPGDPENLKAGASGNPFSGLTKLPKALWFNAISWACFTAAFMSIITFGGSFLVEQGYQHAEASFIAGLIMMVSIPGSLLAGWLVDRWGSYAGYMIAMSLIAGLFFLGFAMGLEPVVMTIGAGMLAAFVPIAVYAFPGSIVKPEQIGLAFGVILTASNIGNSIGPITVGWISNASGNYFPGMLMAAVLMFITTLCGIIIWSILRNEIQRKS